jgi:hypothetical protein
MAEGKVERSRLNPPSFFAEFLLQQLAAIQQQTLAGREITPTRKRSGNLRERERSFLKPLQNPKIQ